MCPIAPCMVLGSCARAAAVARSRPVRCSSSVVEHPLGKGEVESSILSCSTIRLPKNTEKNADFERRRSLAKWNEKEPIPPEPSKNWGENWRATICIFPPPRQNLRVLHAAEPAEASAPPLRFLWSPIRGVMRASLQTGPRTWDQDRRSARRIVPGPPINARGIEQARR